MQTKTRNRPRTGSRAARVLKYARVLAARVESWADFANGLFDQECGFISRMFPNRMERKRFLASPEYREVQRMLGELMERFGVADGATPKQIVKLVVRLPISLRLVLEREAVREAVKLNQLVVAKLTIPLAQHAQGRGF